jgi:hypothetical protein
MYFDIILRAYFYSPFFCKGKKNILKDDKNKW